MEIQFHDVKDILDKVKQGGGGNFSPLEIALAKMAYRYRCKIAEMNEQRTLMFDSLYSVYSTLHSCKAAQDLIERHKKVLSGNSRAHFTQAVHLDQQLKGMIDNEAKETT